MLTMDTNNPFGLVCLSISAADASEVMRILRPVRHLADLVEIRLDAMIDPQPEQWLSQIPLPVLATNRAIWEGGSFTGSEQKRVDLLCRAIRAGATYVDLELASDIALRAELLATATACQSKVILSHHDFQGTPDSASLARILRSMMKAPGIHAGKIVTLATSSADMLRLLESQQKALAAHFPLSAFTMGESGRISRLATLYLGGYMTYVCANKEKTTAPGQLTAQELADLRAILINSP